MINTDEWLVAWFGPYSPGNVSVLMPTNPVFPFVLVKRVAGGDDAVFDRPVVDVSVFHSDITSANQAAWRMHNDIRAWNPKMGVFLPSAGRMVFVDLIETLQGPHYLKYSDENAWRYIMRYEITARLTAA